MTPPRRPPLLPGLDKKNLIAQEDEPVRCVQMLPVVKDFLAPNGEWVLDFGQNITGVVHAKLDLPAGAQVRLRHAESLDENGNFYTGNLSFAKSEDTFRSAGQPAEYLPRFTYHGFRYLCVEGLPESQRDPAAFTACVLTTDLRRTGQFRCSDERVNQLQSNTQWSQQDNFLEVPTDCPPQRSERLGWTGDIRAYGCTALFNSDAALFLKKWLRDLAADQGEDGAVPYVVPDVLDAPGQPVSTASFWGDSAVVLPWEIYMASDNHWLLTDVLRREWGFQGMVVTDWGALCNRVKAMHAGYDLSMPGGSNYMEDWVEAAVQDGSLPESDVDACAARVIALVLKSQTRPKGKPFDREAHHALARRVAESGAVLLKNEDGILPLQAEDVVLIGEMARTMRYQGSGSSHINPTRLISLCEAWPQAPFVPGCDTKGNVTEESLVQAAAAAKSAKVAVVCAGLLTGTANPGGKLTETWPLSYDQVPSRDTFGQKVTRYKEGLYVGYRYYDTAGVPVRYPFGYGLSYTRFAYSDLTVENRPAKELKGFARVYLTPGESRTVDFPLDDRSFAIWSDGWKVPAGTYTLLVGSSSADIRLQQEIEMPGADLPAPAWQAGSWYETLQGLPTDDEFAALYGSPLQDDPPLEPGRFSMEDSIMEMKDFSPLMIQAFRGTEATIAQGFGGKADYSNPDFRMMIMSGADAPLRAAVLSSGGSFPAAAAQGLLAAANGQTDGPA